VKHSAVETPGDDGHIHVIPTFGPEHDETERCWCRPEWDAKNRAEYGRGEADYKVFIHRTVKDLEQ
jgi:hypothetical protein